MQQPSQAEWDRVGLFGVRAWVLLSFVALEATPKQWYRSGENSFLAMIFLISYFICLSFFASFSICAFREHKPDRGFVHLAFALITFLIALHSLHYLAVA